MLRIRAPGPRHRLNALHASPSILYVPTPQAPAPPNSLVSEFLGKGFTLFEGARYECFTVGIALRLQDWHLCPSSLCISIGLQELGAAQQSIQELQALCDGVDTERTRQRAELETLQNGLAEWELQCSKLQKNFAVHVQRQEEQLQMVQNERDLVQQNLMELQEGKRRMELVSSALRLHCE